MGKVDFKVHADLLKEAKVYVENLKQFDSLREKDSIVLTQEHIMEWLEVFYEDRIMMGTCNQAVVKR
jgi:hypothetical protein